MTFRDAEGDRSLRLTALSATAVGLLIMGDSFLYGSLPISASLLGLSLFQVSLLLSVNRWVRLISNSLAAEATIQLPLKRQFAIASVVALGSTLAFVRPLAFPLLLVARVCWGMAWSVFRQSAYMAVWGGRPGRQGSLLGLWWGLARAGSGLSVLLGGWMLDKVGFWNSVSGISVLSAGGVVISFFLPWPVQRDSSAATVERTWTQGFRDSVRVVANSTHLKWMFAVGTGSRLVQTLLVPLAALYIQERGGAAGEALGIGAGTGIVLASHWLSQIFLGPPVGALSDRLGRSATSIGFSISLAVFLIWAATASGLTAFLLAILIMLIFSALRVAVEAGMSESARQTAQAVSVMGLYSTADDLAAAMGPVLGLGSVESSGLSPLFLAGAAVLLVPAAGLTISEFAASRRQHQ